jgi:tetratricopeptide (TPR) repeat protein
MKISRRVAYNVCLAVGKKLRKEKKYDLARTWYSYALRLNPRCSLALAERGETFRREGRFADAIVDLREALKPLAVLASAVMQVPSGRFKEQHVLVIRKHLARVNMTCAHALLGLAGTLKPS